MKTEHEILDDYYNYSLHEFLSTKPFIDSEVKKTFNFRMYVLSVRWKELKTELIGELKKLIFWRS